MAKEQETYRPDWNFRIVVQPARFGYYGKVLINPRKGLVVYPHPQVGSCWHWSAQGARKRASKHLRKEIKREEAQQARWARARKESYYVNLSDAEDTIEEEARE